MQERQIYVEVVINAPLEQVWEAWTTEQGIKSFLAPDCKIDLRPDGAYEIYFNPGAPPGLRGGDGLRVLAVQPMQMLSFTWNAPPSLPEVRPQRTHVLLRFYADGEQQTRLTFRHDGWGTGGEWDKAFEYFQRVWPDVVLRRLQDRFEYGPID
jgi:uncharacterized protein YndB with AHSA1/START domain